MFDQDVIETSDDGRYRVSLMQDVDISEGPDWCGQGYVFDVDYGPRGWTVDELHSPTGDPYADDVREGIQRALERWGSDWDKLERYLRQSHDAVSLDWYDRRGGGRFLEVVTSGMCDEWGIPAGAPIRAEAADLTAWKQWDEGDVWGYLIEERVTWHSEDREDMDTWEHVDSLWGLYGREYAEEEAREALAGVRV